MAWRTLESEKPAPRQSARYFSSQFFFQWKSIFFSSVSSNALAICWRLPSGQQTSVCRQTPSAYPLSPLSPSTLSPIGPQTGLCESHQLHQRPSLGSNPHPPNLHSCPRHLPLTSTSHCPSLSSQPTPQKPVSLTVWLKFGVQAWTASYIIPPTD